VSGVVDAPAGFVAEVRFEGAEEGCIEGDGAALEALPGAVGGRGGYGVVDPVWGDGVGGFVVEDCLEEGDDLGVGSDHIGDVGDVAPWAAGGTYADAADVEEDDSRSAGGVCWWRHLESCTEEDVGFVGLRPDRWVHPYIILLVSLLDHCDQYGFEQASASKSRTVPCLCAERSDAEVQ